MKKWIFRSFAVFLVLLLVTPLALYLLLPRIIQPYLKDKLAQLGCENPKVVARRISTDLAEFAEVYCFLPERGEFHLEGIEISYALGRLYSGNLGKVLVKSAKVSIFSANHADKEKMLTRIPIPESFFTLVPISELEISEIQAHLPLTKEKISTIRGGLNVRFHALSVEGNIRAKSLDPEMEVAANFETSGSQAQVVFEKGKFGFVGYELFLPAGTKCVAKKNGERIDLTIFPEILFFATQKKEKHELRLKNMKAELHEKNVRADLLAAYGPDFPFLAFNFDWSLEKEKLDFRLKPAKIPVAKLMPVAMFFVNQEKQTKIDAGELELNARGTFSIGSGATGLSAAISGELQGVGGAYGEHLFTGIFFPLRIELRGGSFKVYSAELKVAEFNAGFPVKNVKTQLALETKGEGIEVRLLNGEAELFSGKALLPELSLNTAQPKSKFQVELQKLNLGEIVALQKQENISATGLLDGVLPLEITKNGVEVKDGNIHAIPPGGHIAYEAAEGLRGAAEGNPGLKLAVDVLQNFHYKVLDGKVDYRPSGEMSLALRLEGHNPDWSGGRPAHFNFTLSENLLMLLKSLRIANDTGAAIEERMRGE